jgi:predicted PolB exonuclease-like 3'-5' exonuclease
MPEPIKHIDHDIFFFDIETVPCAATGRRILGIADDVNDEAVIREMHRYTDPDQDLPMLKTVMQRVVAISALIRAGGTAFKLFSLPDTDDRTESTIISRFLTAIGNVRPQLVGYNSAGFDLPVLYQRAIIHGLEIKGFCRRPAKPWDAEPDYFSDRNDWNVDLMRVIGGFGKATPKLTEIARACGIPAKLTATGSDVAALWAADRTPEIIAYCEEDVLTTYLLWRRTVASCGLMTPIEHAEEVERFAQFLRAKAQDRPHVAAFLPV